MCVCGFHLGLWFLFRGLKTAEGSPYLTNILEIAFELYVLVTTANSPDIMYGLKLWTPVTLSEFTVKAAVGACVRHSSYDAHGPFPSAWLRFLPPARADPGRQR